DGLARSRAGAPRRGPGDADRSDRAAHRRAGGGADGWARRVLRDRQRASRRMNALYDHFAALAARGVLPEIFQCAFFVRGLISVLLLAPLLGGLSHLVVARRLAFFSAALGQAALTGLTIGIVLGEPLNAAYGGIFGFCF